MTETVLMTLPRVSDANHTGFGAETNVPGRGAGSGLCTPHAQRNGAARLSRSDVTTGKPAALSSSCPFPSPQNDR